jgi:hypothetical protein
MYFIKPLSGEPFYIRLLLIHRKGIGSFKELRTIDGYVYSTYKKAAERLGLLEDDNEWFSCLDEMKNMYGAKALRDTFVSIVVNQNPKDAQALFDHFYKFMGEDISYFIRQRYATTMPSEDINSIVYNTALSFIDKSFRECSNDYFNNYHFNIQTPDTTKVIDIERHAIDINDAAQRARIDKELMELIPLMNDTQDEIFAEIMYKLDNNIGEVYFIDGAAGNGKTFLFNLILKKIYMDKKIAVASAASAVCANLLFNASTAHTKFGIPLECFPDSVSNLADGGSMAATLKKANLILIDEAAMLNKHQVHLIDSLLRKLMKVDLPFGNKV